MGEITYYECAGDDTDITLVCTDCSVTYRARAGSHKDRRHCYDCRVAFLTVQARAITATNKAVRAGTIKRAKGQRCVDCGLPANVLDHRDYTKPLEVDAVCWSCNGRRGGAKWKDSQPTPMAKPIAPLAEAPECAAITLLAAA